jgi:hypothetical protein
MIWCNLSTSDFFRSFMFSFIAVIVRMNFAAAPAMTGFPILRGSPTPM